MRNAGLDECQAGIKIVRRNINSLRYADDITLIAESEKEIKSLLRKVKEDSERKQLKLNIQKTNILTFGHITSWQIVREKVEAVTYFVFLGSKITADGHYSHEIKRHLLLGRKAMTDLDSLLLLLFSCSVASESLQPHGLQDVRFPCPSPSPRVYSNLCPSSR